MVSYFENIFIKLAVAIFLFNIWSCANNNRFQKFAEAEVRESCACFDSTGISASPDVSRLLEQVGRSDFNIDTFCTTIGKLSSTEKEEVFQLTKTVYNEHSKLRNCLKKADAPVVLGNSEYWDWRDAMDNALDKYGCPFVRYLNNMAFVYARFAIDYLKIVDKGCGCFSDSNSVAKEIHPNTIRVLEAAAGKYRAYVYENTYNALNIEEKLLLHKLYLQIDDTASGVGKCLQNIYKEAWDMERNIKLTVYRDSVGKWEFTSSDLRYGDIKHSLVRQHSDCRFYRYFHSDVFSWQDTSIKLSQ